MFVSQTIQESGASAAGAAQRYHAAAAAAAAARPSPFGSSIIESRSLSETLHRQAPPQQPPLSVSSSNLGVRQLERERSDGTSSNATSPGASSYGGGFGVRRGETGLSGRLASLEAQGLSVSSASMTSLSGAPQVLTVRHSQEGLAGGLERQGSDEAGEDGASSSWRCEVRQSRSVHAFSASRRCTFLAVVWHS